MPPVESEAFLRPENQLLVNDSPPTNNPIPVPEPSGKKKKKGKDKNGSKGKDTPTKTLPPMESADLQFSPPSQSDPSSFPGNVFTPPPVTNPALSSVSPVLDALGSITNAESDTATRTGAWAKSVPFGKSPPTDLPDLAGSPLSIPTPFERPGFGIHVSSSASPPPVRARPPSTSYGQYGITPSPHRSVDRQKRHSMGSHLQGQPALPHLPQAHFYGAPEIDIPTPNRLSADSQYSFCGWDTVVEQSLLKSSKVGGRVLVVGTDGGLDVLAIDDHRARTVGSLTGLNGRVLEAKILPYTSRYDPYMSSRPHVAIVLHGPVAHKEDVTETSSTGSDNNEFLPGLPAKPSNSEQRPPAREETAYQTSVEIYSIKTGAHITTLFQSRPAPCFDNYPNLSLLAPASVGSLRLHVTQNYVVVACGVSAEVFIFGIVQSAAGYQCLGKTWTSIQTRETRRYSTSSSSTDHDGSQIDGQHGAVGDSPIISVHGRWLAVVPPTSTARAPPSGKVPTNLVSKKISGLDTHIPPSKPAVNCVTDLGEGESLFDKVARGVAQELVKGARWMGDQGLQAWNNYWNKDQQSQNGITRRSPQTESQQGVLGLFPPTHGQETVGTPSSEPDLISIFDLKKMEEGNDLKGPVPIATFQPPNGCSFLSFGPSGQFLLSASRKGDVQYVWDLMQAKYCRSAVFLSDDVFSNSAATAHVRLVARYSRLTTSTILDIVWTHPSGERFAVITRKGTIHVFDVPRPAFQWPPLRRMQSKPKRNQPEEKSSATPDHLEEPGSASPFAAAMKYVGGSTQPILAAVRGRAPSVGANFSATSSFGTAAGIGGKAVAAGLSKSMGAATGTVNTLRHVGENRLHLSGFSRDPMPSRVVWIPARNESLLGIVDNGVLKLYKIKCQSDRQKGRRQQPVVGAKVMEVKLPSYLRSPCGPLQIGLPADGPTKGSWSLTSHVPHSSSATKVKAQPLSQAEIETNTPYQPFHTDRRVKLHVFTDAASVSGPSRGPWVFGNDIPTQRLHVRPLNQSDEEGEETDEAMDRISGTPEMENLIRLGNSTDQVEEVVITTRRKKRHADMPSVASPGEDEGGFFENDCDILDFARDRV